MVCKDCGHATSVNRICERPIQSATDMLKHMAAHNASRAFAMAERVMEPEPEAILSVEPLPALPAIPWFASPPNHSTKLFTAEVKTTGYYFSHVAVCGGYQPLAGLLWLRQ
jgi:hypothetical protein